MASRKERVEARRANREARRINRSNDIEPQHESDYAENGGELEAATVTAEAIKPIYGGAQIQNPSGINANIYSGGQRPAPLSKLKSLNNQATSLASPNISSSRNRPEVSTHSENGRVLDSAVVTEEGIRPIVGRAEAIKSAGIAMPNQDISTHSENGRVLDASVVTEEGIRPIRGRAEALRKAGIAIPNEEHSQDGGELDAAVVTEEGIRPIVGKAEAQKKVGIAVPNNNQTSYHSENGRVLDSAVVTEEGIKPIIGRAEAKRKAGVALPNNATYNETHSENGRELDAAVVTEQGIKPIVGRAEQQNPATLEDHIKSRGSHRAGSLPNVTPIVGNATTQDNARIATPKVQVNTEQVQVNEQPEYESTHSENGRVLDAPVVTEEGIKPIIGKAEIQNPVGPDIRMYSGGQRPAPVQRVEPIQGKAEAGTTAGPIVNPINQEAKPMTFSDLLASQRESAANDKTNAAKMEKYYALTDALNALGKMGGTVVGGAIGGNVLDSAPNIGEYKPSRGYLDAVEKSKKANDRLRELEEKEFQLAYRKKEKEEDREYQRQQEQDRRTYTEQQKADERKWQEEQNKSNREWKAEQDRITREWNQAVKEGDFKKQAALQKELLAIKAKYEAEDDKRNREYMKAQYDLYNPSLPVMFRDGSSANLTDKQLERMLANFKGQTIGGVKITKDNFDEVLRSNPKEFESYLKMIGVTLTPPETAETGTASNPTPKSNHINVTQTREGQFIPKWFAGDYEQSYTPIDPLSPPKKYSKEEDKFASFLE